MPGSTLDFLLDAAGIPQPWTAVYNGIEYPGELVSADEWEPRWGEPLVGDAFFRIVFLSAPVVGVEFDLKDGRVAVCLPGDTLALDAGPLGAEVRSIREARAAYATRPGSGTEPLQSALEEAEQLARKHLLEAAAQGFGAGTVVGSSGDIREAGDVAPGPVTDYWIDILAAGLLADTYPLIPIDGLAFPYPLDPQATSLLHQAMFATHPSADAIEAFRNFGPGLALTPPGYDDCPILDVIQEAMAGSGNAVGVSVLMDRLTHQEGIPKQLAALYLLAFIARNTPAVQVSVKATNAIQTMGGTAFPGDRITRDLLGSIAWSPELADGLDSLSLLQPPTWSTVVPYAERVSPDTAASRVDDTQLQARLMASLKELATETAQIASGIGSLSRDQGAPMPTELSKDIETVQAVTAAGDFTEFYRDCVQHFGSPIRLGEAIDRVRGLSAFAAEVGHYRNMVEYVASVPTATGTGGPGELMLIREALLAQLSLGQLVEAPSRWPALREQGEGFIRQYTVQYRAHHVEYHMQMAILQERLVRAATRVGALQRLNDLPAVGPTVNPELAGVYEKLVQDIHPCEVPGDEVALEMRPTCEACGLDTWDMPPVADVDHCLHQLEIALETQMARLRERFVGLVLDEADTPPVDRFLRVLRAADLDAFPDALDDRVAEFLKTLLPS